MGRLDGWVESEKVETIMKYLLNELHADETSFSEMHSPFCEANKRLSSEQREDPLTSSVFLLSLAKLQASLIQLVVTAVTTSATSIQIKIPIQACSGLSVPLLQVSPKNYSTFQAPNNEIIDNPCARMSVNVSTSSSVD